ncbi:Membrane metallo-endopeptidase-like 1 [Apodemus speciosus]|uniref:Membrane metallo-endopeptidase-like 1 n=1 Tax=Apodemus speciosus TaxID=105296 RepID=A0ABQ0F6L5_APOSI
MGSLVSKPDDFSNENKEICDASDARNGGGRESCPGFLCAALAVLEFTL